MDTKFDVMEPIPLAERKPDESDKDSCGRCYFGRWVKGDKRWSFTLANEWDKGYTFNGVQVKPHTHWLPANVEVLPVRCHEPLEDPFRVLERMGWVVDRLPTKEDGDADGDVLIYCGGVHHDRCGWRTSGQAFVHWNFVVAKQPWKPIPVFVKE